MSTNSGPCTACVTGKYKIASGSAACTDCASAKFTTTTGATLESACNTCNVGFTGPDGGVCSTCAAGKYKSIIGSAVCTDCPVNTYQRPNPLADMLISSPAYLAGSAADWDSANNRFTDLSGNARHGAMSAGTVTVGSATGNGAGREIPYVGGTTATKIVWPAGSIQPTFTICSITRYTGGSNKRIFECLNLNWLHGHWNGYAGAMHYDYDQNLQYGISPNTNWVVACGRNTVTAGAVGTIINGVVTSTAKGGNGNCQLNINAGTYQASESSDWQLSRLYVWNTHLTDATFNTASSNLNSYVAGSGEISSVTCVSCPAGTTSPVASTSSTACISAACNAGFTGPDGGACTACVAGKYKIATGSATCTDCAAGTYSTTTGATIATTCITCPTSSSSPLASSALAACICNVGFTGPDGGACTACVAGKYKIATGSAACTDCGAGTYSTTVGATIATTCIACPTSSSSPISSTSVAACTCNAGSTGPDGGLTLTTDSTNLVAWYKLNGDLTDSTGRTGSLINAGGTLAFAQDTTLNSNLPYSWYAVGSGTSNLNYARTPVIDRNVPLSFAFWFKTTGSGGYTILSYGDKSVENPSIQFDYNSGKLAIATALSAQWTTVPEVSGLVVNTWYFVVYTLSNANPVSAILYIDGTQRATGTGAAGQTLPRFKDLTVANSGDTGRGFAGHIGDIRIYDKVLIQAEITSLFTNMPTPCTTCAAGKYKIASGSAACTDCAANTFSSVTGATSSAVCASCATGFSPAVSGTGACTSTSSTLQRSCGLSGTDACSASQSSDYGVSYSSIALDGNLDSSSITSNGGSVQWWRLDFGRSVSVAQVIVYNRKDCCWFRLAGFKITVGDSPSVDVNTVCASNQPAPTVSPFMAQVTCPTPLLGQYLHISIYGNPTEHLQIAEVQVTGCPACQVLCAAGTYRVASACVNCAAGKYSPTAGATLESTCIACPGNSNSPGASTALAACTCNAGTYNKQTVDTIGPINLIGDANHRCSYLNSYNEPNRQAMCAPAVGSCQLCPYTCMVTLPPTPCGRAEPWVCVDCVAGSYSSTTGSTACTNCAAGTYSTTVGATIATTCIACPANSNSPSPSSALAACTCNAGTYTAPDPLAAILAANPAYLATSAEAWDAVNNRFTDVSGNARHGTLTAGTASVGTVTGNGAGQSVAYVGGTTTAKIQWPSASVPSTFTICSITRYTGPTYGRILDCSDKNWLHGQYADYSGTYAGSIYYTDSQSAARYSISPVTNWVVACGRNTATAGATSSIVNGVVTSTAFGGYGNCQLSINYNDAYNIADWQLSKLYIWNTHLSNEVFAQASAQLNSWVTATSAIGACVTCVAGKFATAVGSSVCTDCLAGTYSTSTGATLATTCITCPTSSSSPLASSALAACICNVGFTGPNGGTCTACVAGKYKIATGSAACSDCGAGTYSTTVGATIATTCIACPTSSSSPSPSSVATSCTCNVGFMDMNSGTCTACASGSYGNGWTLVRRVPTGNAWHPATDGLVGTAVYGTYSNNPQDNNIGTGWSINFETAVPGYNEFRFATGDGQVWLITTKAAIGGKLVTPNEFYADGQRQIMSSSDSSTPYVAKWYYRSGSPEDPWISVLDHTVSAPGYTILYGGNSWTTWGYATVLNLRNGANVFIRKAACTSCLAGTYSTTAGATTCTTCPANSGASCSGCYTSACPCNAGYVGGNFISPYSSTACARFISLMIWKPSFASVSTRLNAAVGTVPTYSATGGPSGKGHVSFARASSQYLDAGSRTFNIATNGGFTAVAVVRFTGTAGDWERIIDFGSGAPIDNFVITRYAAQSDFYFGIRNGVSITASIQTTGGNLVQNSWLTVVCTYRTSTNVFACSVNGISFTVNPSALQTDRTASFTYIGKSWSTGTPYLNGDIAGLFFVDEFLNTDATTAIVNTIVNGVDMTDTTCPAGNACTACAAGKYKIATGSAICTDCGVGTYQSSTGSSVCTTCPTNSGASCTACYTSACPCNAGYVGGNFISPYSSTACSRFISLMIWKPSFASVSTRLNAAVGTLPTYNALGGPSGKGHVSFDRASSQYLDAGSRTFNIATNGGFTMVAVVRFTGTFGVWERILDMGNGPDSDNILIARKDSRTIFTVEVRNGAIIVASADVTDAITQNSWLTVVVSYRTSNKVMSLTVNGVVSTTTGSTAVTDKTVSKSFTGKSNYPDAFLNGDIAGLFAVDEFLSTDATAAIVNTIVNGVDMTDTTCPAGNACTACIAGKYKIATGSATCTDCSAGTYSTTAGATIATTCIACPTSSSSPISSSAVAACTCNAGTSASCATTISTLQRSCGVSGTDTCSAEQSSREDPIFFPAADAIDQNVGTFSHTATQISPWWRLDFGRSVIVTKVIVYNRDSVCCRDRLNNFKITVGDSSSDDVNAVCASDIPAPTVSPYMADVPCATPLRGQYLHISLPGTARTLHVAEVQVTGCPDGGVCSPCAAGKYKTATGSAVCTDCAAGKYSTTTGATLSTTCAACPANTGSSCIGCSAAAGCTCNVGYTGPDGGVCSACTAGTYKDITGSAACTDCAAGKYSATTAATAVTTCVGCLVGTNSPAGSTSSAACIFPPCNAGYTGPNGMCSACATGKYKSETGSAACTDCGPATYSSNLAASTAATCLACPADKTSPAASTSSAACVFPPCNAGYTGPDGICSTCAAGTYKVGTGPAPCTPCVAGKYSTIPAATAETACLACTANSNSPIQSSTAVSCTCNAGYSGPNGGICSPCAAGKYKPLTGPATCTSCTAFSGAVCAACNSI